MPIYISVVTHAIDLPMHPRIFQEHVFNCFIQCGEDYPLMYNGDSHRWYLKLSYLDGMPNSNILHQTTVMMIRCTIYFLLKGCLHLWSRLVRTDYGLQDWCRETEGEREDFITILWHQSGWKVTHFFQPIDGPSWGYTTFAVFGDARHSLGRKCPA